MNEKAESPQKTDEKASEPSYNFPAIGPEDYGLHHLDKDNLILWIGVRVDPAVHDYEGACAFLLSMKHTLYQFYKEVARQMRVRRALANPPAAPLSKV